MMFWLVVAGWLVVCGFALRWTLPRIEAAQKDLEHEEALLMNEEWDEEGYPVGLPPVPPILNQSERWLTNAREAESADDDWDRGDAA